ncbi:MAG TPA: ATP-binding protein [Thermotogota bacterium]|nr:ATP-binding protein [Thermotogota bacterium]HRW92549.1 ATP-binding protein [Thermotogota bacterium]
MAAIGKLGKWLWHFVSKNRGMWYALGLFLLLLLVNGLITRPGVEEVVVSGPWTLHLPGGDSQQLATPSVPLAYTGPFRMEVSVEPGRNDALLLPPFHARQLSVYWDDQLLHIFPSEHGNLVFWPTHTFLVLPDTSAANGSPHTLRLESSTGGGLHLVSNPVLGQHSRLYVRTTWLNFLNSDLFLTVVGMSFLIALILFVVAPLNREIRLTYVCMSIASMYYAAEFLFSFFAQVRHIPYPPILDQLFYVGAFVATFLIFLGIEWFLSRRWVFSKFFLLVNLGFFVGMAFDFWLVGSWLSAVNFFFFLVLAFRMAYPLLAFGVFFRILAEFSSSLGEPLGMNGARLNALSFVVLWICFAAFLIRQFKTSHLRLQETMMELSASHEELTAMNEELESSYHELDQLNKTLETKVHQRTRDLQVQAHSVRMLLDNAEEGFLKFDATLAVDPEFSSECVRFFGKDIAGCQPHSLFFPRDPEMASQMERILQSIFREKDAARRDIFLSLLPEEFSAGPWSVQATYRWIQDPLDPLNPRIMVILKDITQRKQLESQVERERNHLKMIVQILSHFPDFEDLVSSFRLFWSKEFPALLEQDSNRESTYFELFRKIHNFKGNFSIFGLRHLVDQLHERESLLSSEREKMLQTAPTFWAKWVDPEPLLDCLEQDTKILQQEIGPDAVQRLNTLNWRTAVSEQIRLVEDKVLQLLPREKAVALFQKLRAIRYVPFHELLKTSPQLVESIAQRLEKAVLPLEIAAQPVLVDPSIFQPFARSLVHLFRNCLDHGIEDPQERVEKGKPEKGRIRVEVFQNDSSLQVVVQDDGKGIDWAQIHQEARKKGFFSDAGQTAVDSSSSELLLARILLQRGFSTREKATEYSGRGVGLNAVFSEVTRLGGDMDIHSTPNQGTTFVMRIPLDPRIPQAESEA